MMQTPRRIRIVSRYVPVAGRAGHFTYLLEMMSALYQHGFQLELDVLDPWFLPENIPPYISHIAQVVIMPASLLRSPCHARTPSLKAKLRPIYHRIPDSMLAPLRKAWYRLQRRDLPGDHLPDALATDAEIAFVKQRVEAVSSEILMTNETFLGNILHEYRHEHTMLKVNIAFDVHHQRQEQFSASEISTRHSSWDRQKEIDALSAADMLLAIHDDDAALLRDMLPLAETICVPCPIEFRAHDEAEQIAGRCLFVGSRIDHNVHGIRWFLREVWPLVFAKAPQATLHICGTVCESLGQIAVSNVRLLGRVDDLNAEYGAAQVCLIPLIAGSGLKIKLIEALSHGRACVSTSVGVQGVRELTNRALFVADASADFAAAVVRLLDQPETRKEMERNAGQYVMERLTPEHAYRPLLDRLHQFYVRNERQTL